MKKFHSKILDQRLNCIQSFIEVPAVTMCSTCEMYNLISFYLYSPYLITVLFTCISCEMYNFISFYLYSPYLITVLFIDNLKSVILFHISSS